MSGGAGNDRIFGSDGPDIIDFGAAVPRTDTDKIYSHGGDDVIDARDRERDVIHCGAGDTDKVYTDPGLDDVRGGCETVFP